MTAHGSLEVTIEAIKRGAFYYLEKPFTFDQVLILAQRALQFKAIKEESRRQKTVRPQDQRRLRDRRQQSEAATSSRRDPHCRAIRCVRVDRR